MRIRLEWVGQVKSPPDRFAVEGQENHRFGDIIHRGDIHFNIQLGESPKLQESLEGGQQEMIGNAVTRDAIPAEPPALDEIRRIVTIFRELRAGMTADGKTKLKSPSGTLSTAEAISVVNNGQALAAHFGDGKLRAGDVAAGLVGAVIKDPVQDKIVWQEYLETVAKERKEWKDLYRACKEMLE